MTPQSNPVDVGAILPCPFCGGECVVDTIGGPNTPFQVECTKCTATGPRDPYEKKAVAFWNKRALCDEVEALRERVRELETKYLPMKEAEITLRVIMANLQTKLQPGGSPPHTGELGLALWIINEAAKGTRPAHGFIKDPPVEPTKGDEV